MMPKKILAAMFIGLTLMMLFPATDARAEYCCFNPLFLPFAAAGLVLGTAAAIVTAPFAYPYPAYYGPPPPRYYAPAPAPAYYVPGPYRAGAGWVRGYYDRNGYWVPGHRRDSAWVPGYRDRYGHWVPGHYR